jgi:hypothetical protein
MNNNLTKGINMLNAGEYTCVLCKGETVYTSRERGIKPLLGWLDSEIDLQGFSAADRIVGRAASFLYILLEVKEIYAPVMSEEAVNLFSEYGIEPRYDVCVKNIINRTGDGICPMEKAVSGLTAPAEAERVLRKKVCGSGDE